MKRSRVSMLLAMGFSTVLLAGCGVMSSFGPAQDEDATCLQHSLSTGETVLCYSYPYDDFRQKATDMVDAADADDDTYSRVTSVEYSPDEATQYELLDADEQSRQEWCVQHSLRAGWTCEVTVGEAHTLEAPIETVYDVSVSYRSADYLRGS